MLLDAFSEGMVSSFDAIPIECLFVGSVIAASGL
jgi:hypothetical protein